MSSKTKNDTSKESGIENHAQDRIYSPESFVNPALRLSPRGQVSQSVPSEYRQAQKGRSGLLILQEKQAI